MHSEGPDWQRGEILCLHASLRARIHHGDAFPRLEPQMGIPGWQKLAKG
jgi:hypothetical protein